MLGEPTFDPRGELIPDRALRLSISGQAEDQVLSPLIADTILVQVNP